MIWQDHTLIFFILVALGALAFVVKGQPDA